MTTAIKKLYVKTQGCQMNEYDSSQMANLLTSTKGIETTDNIEDADIALLNTCSIREKAAEKVFSELGRWRAFKKKNPNLMIGVGGCVASQEGKACTVCRHGVRSANFASLTAND